MGKKVWAALVAGGLLLGAGFLTSAITAPEIASAQEGSDDTEPEGPISRIFGFLGDVLEGLVDDGTITQDQADAIVDRAQEKAGQLREEHQENFDLLRDFLDDGGITEDEASQLPDDHFLFSDRFDEAWEDGELSIDEVRGSLHQFRRGPFRRGFHLGSILDGGGIDREEYEALPDGHPLKQVDVTEYLEDGLITPRELSQIITDLHEAHSDAANTDTSS